MASRSRNAPAAMPPWTISTVTRRRARRRHRAWPRTRCSPRRRGADLMASSWMLPVSPFAIDPRMVSGPTQKTRLAVTNPSAIRLGRSLLRQAPLEPGAERLEAVVQSQQLPDRHADQHRRKDGQVVAGPRRGIGEDAEAHVDAEEGGEQAEARRQARLHALGHAAAEQQPDQSCRAGRWRRSGACRSGTCGARHRRAIRCGMLHGRVG